MVNLLHEASEPREEGCLSLFWRLATVTLGESSISAEGKGVKGADSKFLTQSFNNLKCLQDERHVAKHQDKRELLLFISSLTICG